MQILDLGTIGVHLENCYGSARDIEWAVFNVSLALKLRNIVVFKKNYLNPTYLLNNIRLPIIRITIKFVSFSEQYLLASIPSDDFNEYILLVGAFA